TLLVSNGGSVTATCESAGAFPLFLGPKHGFQAGGLVPGPAAAATGGVPNTPNAIPIRGCLSGGQTRPPTGAHTQPQLVRFLLHRQGKDRAGCDRAPGKREHVIAELGAWHDRVSPRIEFDELG